LPLLSDKARWQWIRTQADTKPELAIRALRAIGKLPENYEDFELLANLQRARRSRNPNLIVDLGFEPNPYVVERLLFDEPKELQPFLRFWYFARTQDEKNRVIEYISTLVAEWGRVPSANRRFFLYGKLTATTKELPDSDILAKAAQESLKKLRP